MARNQSTLLNPTFSAPTHPAARCMHQLRLREPLTRSDLVKDTGLSQATVTRQITALIDAGLVRERPDLAVTGAAGRPRIPLEMAPAPWVHAGIHVGLKVSRVVLVDTHGHLVREHALDLDIASTDPEELLEHLVACVHLLRTGLRLPLCTAGIALAGRIENDCTVTSRVFGWDSVPVADILGDGLDVPVTIAPHVAAMAASELFATPLQGRRDDDPRAATRIAGGTASDSSLYFYAREQIGLAWTIGGRVHLPATGDGSIGHLPAGESALLNADGRATLQSALGNTGVLATAAHHGLAAADLSTLVRIAAPSSPGGGPIHTRPTAESQLAREILDDRARLLGLAITQAADMVDPGHIVLAGEAFAGDPVGLRTVARTVSSNSASRRDLRVSRSRGGVTLDAARAVALDALYTDPLSIATGAAAAVAAEASALRAQQPVAAGNITDRHTTDRIGAIPRRLVLGPRGTNLPVAGEDPPVPVAPPAASVTSLSASRTTTRQGAQARRRAGHSGPDGAEWGVAAAR